MIRIVFSHGMELKDHDVLNHYWCKLIPALKLAYNTSIHDSTGKALAMLEKGWNLKLAVDTLKKELVEINPNSSSFKLLSDKLSSHANQIMTDAFDYSKKNGEKAIKPQNSK
ncbi:hypothetical protein O181_002959 [Austropuccinia psidii MF-1]|uniref:Uncharacterized protein n=1 Tax=Austropuccinia psidii MF-1 TaxID=1389203 RepID=A0A9Q3BD92_9BASI|nr:hypothetical protein [Austropuccinia psidii MF-1]